jgi:hypothetical protein
VVVGHEWWSELASATSSQNSSPAGEHLPRSASKKVHLADVLAASTAAAVGGVTPGQVPTKLERTPSAPHVGAGRVAEALRPAPGAASEGAGPGPDRPSTATMGNKMSSTAPKGATMRRQLLPRRACRAAGVLRTCFGPAVRACLGLATLLPFRFPLRPSRHPCSARETRLRGETCSKFEIWRRRTHERSAPDDRHRHVIKRLLGRHGSHQNTSFSPRVSDFSRTLRLVSSHLGRPGRRPLAERGGLTSLDPKGQGRPKPPRGSRPGAPRRCGVVGWCASGRVVSTRWHPCSSSRGADVATTSGEISLGGPGEPNERG